MKHHLNLMSQPARHREALRRVVRLWSQVTASVVLVLVPVGLATWWRCDDARRRQAVASAQYEPIRKMKNENDALKKQIESLLTQERVPLVLSRRQPVLSLVGLASRAVAEEGGTVYLEQLALEQSSQIENAANGTRSTCVLEGIGRDVRGVSQLADRLRTDGPFTHVGLETDETNRPGAENVQQFTIHCELAPGSAGGH